MNILKTLFFMRIFFSGFFIFQCHLVFAQLASGTIIDQESGQPIPFVNIGIINQNTGTISDANGQYQFLPSKDQLDDTVTIQHVSYETKSLPVSVFIDEDEIYLKEKISTLKEVQIFSKKLKQKKFGIRSHNPLLHGALGVEKGSIHEIAQEIKIKKPTRLLDLNVFLRIYTDSLPYKYRIKFYASTDDAPGEMIDHPDILVEGLNHKWNAINLEPYDIIMKEDFFVSIEFLPIEDSKIPHMSAGAVLTGGNRYSRNVSFGTWNKAMGGYSLYVTGEY